DDRDGDARALGRGICAGGRGAEGRAADRSLRGGGVGSRAGGTAISAGAAGGVRAGGRCALLFVEGETVVTGAPEWSDKFGLRHGGAAARWVALSALAL